MNINNCRQTTVCQVLIYYLSLSARWRCRYGQQAGYSGNARTTIGRYYSSVKSISWRSLGWWIRKSNQISVVESTDTWWSIHTRIWAARAQAWQNGYRPDHPRSASWRHHYRSQSDGSRDRRHEICSRGRCQQIAVAINIAVESRASNQTSSLQRVHSSSCVFQSSFKRCICSSVCPLVYRVSLAQI